MKAIESDSQATIQNQEITIKSLKKEKEVCSFEFLIVNFVLSADQRQTFYICVLSLDNRKRIHWER